jgi:hypothetical protein
MGLQKVQTLPRTFCQGSSEIKNPLDFNFWSLVVSNPRREVVGTKCPDVLDHSAIPASGPVFNLHPYPGGSNDLGPSRSSNTDRS